MLGEPRELEPCLTSATLATFPTVHSPISAAVLTPGTELAGKGHDRAERAICAEHRERR